MEGGGTVRALVPSRTTVVRVLVGCVVLIAVAPFIVHAAPQVVGATQSYVVTSGSMAPAINAGDIVVVDTVEPETIRAGDVITFRRAPGDESPTTHRVIDVLQSGGELAFQTKGDANEEPDPEPLPANQVFGEVIFVIPYLGYVVRFANTAYGFVALVLAPLGLLVATEVRRIVSATRMDTSTASAATGSSMGGGEPDGIGEIPADGDETSDGAGYTLTPTDLRLTLVVLVAFTAYSGWVLYTEGVTMWSVMVTVATAGGVILVAGLVFFGGQPIPDEDPDRHLPASTGSRDSRAVRFVVVDPETVTNHTDLSVEVSSLDALVEMAWPKRESILKDPGARAYYLVNDDVIYTYAPEGPPRFLNGTHSSENGPLSDESRTLRGADFADSGTEVSHEP